MKMKRSAFFLISAAAFSNFSYGASSYPYIAGNTFKAIADHVVDGSVQIAPSNVQCGDIVYVDSDYWQHFFTHVHPSITAPYILVTHNNGTRADESRPGPYAGYLDDPQLFVWFSSNVEQCRHPKMVVMPLGIANREYLHGNIVVLSNSIAARRAARAKMVYLNMKDETCKTERGYVRKLFSNKPFCTVITAPTKSYGEYLYDLAEHQFVLSPRGNGLDCHRTWEALLMGCIPIVKTSDLDVLYKNLPVLIVASWEEITAEFLEEQYVKIQSIKYDLRMIYADYWIAEIKGVQTLLRNSSWKR